MIFLILAAAQVELFLVLYRVLNLIPAYLQFAWLMIRNMGN